METSSGSDLVQLIRDGDFDAFEARCLELLETGDLRLADLDTPFKYLETTGHAGRVATLAQMALESADQQADPHATLEVARVALNGDPLNAELRKLTVAAYRSACTDNPAIEGLLIASGLTGSRPARSALRVLDLCLSLKPGDALLSRTEDLVVEVTDIDPQHGLFTLRRADRPTTIPAAELASGYEKLDPDDVRVLRTLHPERLRELIQQDPVALVSGMARAHGDQIDSDTLKHELVPQYILPNEWSRWWTRARTKLKRSPNIIIEGRSPVFLRYCAEGRSIEDETWDAVATQTEPIQWLKLIDEYLREKRRRRETPADDLLTRLHEHLAQHIDAVRQHRPAEALATAFVSDRLEQSRDRKGAAGTAAEMLRQCADPVALIGRLLDDAFWSLALDALTQARPDDGARCAVKLMPHAPASMLDQIAAIGLEAGLHDPIQQRVDQALADPVHHTELIYWLWRGPKHADRLNLPPDAELFGEILDTFSALGRTLTTSRGVTRDFRLRMRAALGLRDYERARRCLEQVSRERAVTVRRELERVEGMGDNAPRRLLDMLREVHPQVWAVATKRLEPWEDSNVLWATAAGLRRKTGERDHLVNVTMHENAKRIGEAASHGDLSENSEYRFALEERDLLRARLACMNDELSKARTLEVHDVPADHVGVGSRVTLRNVTDGGERIMTFLGPFETDVEQAVYSYQAPVSQQLMGRRQGDRVTLTIDAREVEYEITAITSGLTPTDA